MKSFRLFKARKSNQSPGNNVNKMANESGSFEVVNEIQEVNENKSNIQTNDQQAGEIPSFTIFDTDKIAEINNVKILTRIAIESDSFIVGTDAVRFINDESALIDVIKGSKDSFVQEAAFDKLSDEGLIILAKDSSGEAYSDSIFSEVSERIKNPLKLVEVLKCASRDDEWDNVVRHIDDQKILAKVASKLEYLTYRGNSILENLTEPQALAYVIENAADVWMRDEAFKKLERIKPDIIKDVKNGRYSLAEYFKVYKENETVEENKRAGKLRFQDESFMYSEEINGWEVIYTSDLYQEVIKLNIKEYQNDCLLDGVKLKPLNQNLIGVGVNIKAEVVCPKCQEMFDLEHYVGAGMGGSIPRCTNCGFNIDFHFSGENEYYYVIAYTYVNKPYDIRKVPKPSIFISWIENLH